MHLQAEDLSWTKSWGVSLEVVRKRREQINGKFQAGRQAKRPQARYHKMLNALRCYYVFIHPRCHHMAPREPAMLLDKMLVRANLDCKQSECMCYDRKQPTQVLTLRAQFGLAFRFQSTCAIVCSTLAPACQRCVSNSSCCFPVS